MTIGQLEALLRQKFDLATKVAKLPDTVKSSFCNLEHCNFKGVKFDMVNPGEPMSTDAIMAGVPNKQLHFAALNANAAIVFYEFGSFVGQDCVTVFDFQERATWGGSFTGRRLPKTLEELRNAILAGEFVQWHPGDRSP